MKKTFINPFWLMHRSPINEKANCCMSKVTWNELINMGLGEDDMQIGLKSTLTSLDEHVPVITNHVEIKQGSELVMETDDDGRKRSKESKRFVWDTLKKHKAQKTS